MNTSKTLTAQKQDKFLFGSCLIPDGEMERWKNASGEFGREKDNYHSCYSVLRTTNIRHRFLSPAPSLHPLHIVTLCRCICIFDGHLHISHILQAVRCLQQHVILSHCWPVVFMSVKHMQECYPAMGNKPQREGKNGPHVYSPYEFSLTLAITSIV